MDRRFFVLFVAATLLGYAVVETLFILRAPLVMDELQGAHDVYQLTLSVPYRDYAPYKTLLGYYVQLPVLESVHGVWPSIMAVKLEMLFLVVVSLAIACVVLRRHLRGGAILGALLLLVVMTEFLERSADLRVDMLTALFGLFSLLYLLSRRPAWSGAMAAIGFLVSQKGAYAVLAGAAALLAMLSWRETARYAAAATATLLTYLAFWSLFAPTMAVMRSVFASAVTVALNGAIQIHQRYWSMTLFRNPLYYGLAVAAVVVLALRWQRDPLARQLAAYGAVFLVLGYWHRQPWPYYFVLLAPAIFVLHAALFDRLATTRPRIIAIAVICALLGVAYPLLRLHVTFARDNTPQRWAVSLAESILDSHDTYLACADVLYDHEQYPQVLRWTDGATMQGLRRLSPEQLEALARDVERAPNKLVIFSYRIVALPQAIRSVLVSRFAPLWGCVLVFTPAIQPGAFELPFPGDYAVLPLTPSGETKIDGRAVAAGQVIYLAKGSHRQEGTETIRLQFQPRGWKRYADPRFRDVFDFFPNMYDY